MKRAFASAALAVLLALPASAAGVEKTQGVYVTFLSGLKADVGETAAKAEARSPTRSSRSLHPRALRSRWPKR
jgi:hypothetical protein